MDIRSCSPEERARIAAIIRSHGRDAAKRRFGISDTSITSLMKEAEGQQKSTANQIEQVA